MTTAAESLTRLHASPSILLVLLKLAHASAVDTSMMNAADADALDDVLLTLDELGLVTLTSIGSAFTHVVLTTAGQHAVQSAGPGLLNPADSGSAKAGAALWLWLITRGSGSGSYGGDWGRRGEVAHLLLCGIDLTVSGAVRDDTWTDFVNSYVGHGSDVTVGVSGNATCRCGHVAGFRVSAEVESITALVLSVLG